MYFSKVNSDMKHLTFNLNHNLFPAYAKMFLSFNALATMTPTVMYDVHVVYVTGQTRRWAFISEDQNIATHFLYTGSLFIRSTFMPVEQIYGHICEVL